MLYEKLRTASATAEELFPNFAELITSPTIIENSSGSRMSMSGGDREVGGEEGSLTVAALPGTTPPGFVNAYTTPPRPYPALATTTACKADQANVVSTLCRHRDPGMLCGLGGVASTTVATYSFLLSKNILKCLNCHAHVPNKTAS